MTRLLWVVFCAAAGAVGAYYAQPYTTNNADVALFIVTVFTVFAGFLIAIITVIGDPMMIREGAWRLAEAGHDRMRNRLFGHIILFIIYLLTIAILFIGIILERAYNGQEHVMVRDAAQWSYLFLGITSFLLTLALPISLWNMQKARYEAEIERRRAQAGIKS